MSTRDERVVSLKFDNAQFERGASESMSTLDKLKEKLKFKDSEKDLDKLQRSVDNVSFTKIQKSLESLEQRFSVMGIAGMRVIENLVDKALSGLGKIEAATLGQIRKGGWSRAMNLANAQFQIEGLGYAWEQVEKAVSYGVQDTAYGLDAAASAASQLAASGVDFTKVLYQVGNEGITQMHKALRGISGVAAMTNSQYEDISRIFTRVAGQGKVMATDLNSIAARGLNAAAEIGKYLGVTEAQVRDMVSKSQIDFMTFADAMDSAFGDHAKEANKTFQGALSNMKAALSRIGALFATPIVNKSNNIFNAMTKQINNAKKALADIEDEMTGVKIERFESHFSQAWDAMTESVVAFIEGINPDWFKSIADVFDKAAIKLRDFFTTFSGTVDRVKEKVEAAKESVVIPLQDAMAAFEIFFNGKYGSGNARVKALQAAGRDAKKVQTLIDAWYKAGFDPAKLAVDIENTNAKDLAEWLDEVRKNGYKLDQTKKKLGESTSELTEEVEQELTKEEQLARTYLNLADALEKLTQIIGNSFKIIGNVIKDSWGSIKKTLDPLGMSTRINDTITWFRDLTEEIKRLTDFTGLDRIEELSEKIASGAENAHVLNEELKQLIHDNKDQAKVRDIFDSLARSVSNVLTVMRNLGRAAFNIGKAMFRAFRNVFSPTGVASGIEDVTWTFANLSEALVRFTEKAAPLVEGAFTLIFSAIKSGISIVKDIVVAVGNFFSNLVGVNDTAVDFSEAGEKIATSFKKAPTLFERIGDLLKGIAGWFEKIPAFFHELSVALSDNDGIKRLRDSFSGFGDKVGEVLGKLKPLKDDVADAIGNQNNSKSAAQTIADAIGWIADKLAAVVEWAPKAVKAVSDFFKGAKDTIVGFFSKGDTSQASVDQQMAAIYGMPANINAAVSPDKANETSKNVESFFGKIGEAIKNAFKSIDFGELKNLAILGVTLYSLVSLGRTADRVSSVPKSISKLFQGIGDALTNYTVAMKEQAIWEARLKFLEGLVKALIALSGWIVIMGSIDQITLSRGLAVMLFLTAIIGLVANAISKMYASKQSKILQQNGIVNMYNTVSGLAAIGVLLLGFAAVMYSLVKVMQVLDGLKNVERSLIGAGVILAVLIGAVVAIVALLVYFTKNLKPLTSSKLVGPNSTSAVGGKLLTSSSGRVSSETEKSPLTGPLLALAAILMSLATSVAVLSIAAAIISKLHVNWTAIGLVAVLVAAMSVCVGVMIRAAGKFGTDVWQMLGIAAAIISFSLAIKIMATAIVTIIAEVALIAKVAGAGAAIAAVVAPVLAIVAVIGVISHGIVKMAEAMSKLDGKSVWTVPASLLLIAGIITALGIVLGVLAKFDPWNLLAAAGSIGLVMLALGASVAIMTGGKYAKDSKAIMATAVGLIAMAGSILIISYALKNLAGVPFGKLVTATLAVTGVMLALGLFVAFVGKNEQRIEVLSAISGMLVSFGASALLCAAGLSLINKTLPAFAAGITLVLAAVNKYKLAIGLVIALLTVLYFYVSPIITLLKGLAESLSELMKGMGKGIGSMAAGIGKGLGSVIGSLGKIIGGALSTIWNAISGFFSRHKKEISSFFTKTVPNMFKKLGSSLVKGAKNMSPSVKTMIATIMAAIGAGFSENGEGGGIFGALGRFLVKIFDWLVASLPVIVDRLLVLVITIVESLALAIGNHSGRIAAAFWAVVSSLIGLLLNVIDQALRILPFGDAIANVLNLDKAGDKMSKRAAVGIAEARLKELKDARERGEAVSAEEYAKAEQDLRKAISEWEDAGKFDITRERLDEVMADVKLYDRLLEKQREHIALTKEEQEAMDAAQINWAWFRNNQSAIQGTDVWQQWMADNETIEQEIKKLGAASTAELEDISHAYHYQEVPKEFLGYHAFMNYDEEDFEKFARAAEAEMRARAVAVPQNVNASTMQYWDAAAKDQYNKAKALITAADEGFKDAFDASIHRTFAEGSIDEMMSGYYPAAAIDQATKYRQNQIDKNLSQTVASYPYMESAAKDQAAKYVSSWTGSVKEAASDPSTGVAATAKKEIVEPTEKEVGTIPDFMKTTGGLSVAGFVEGAESKKTDLTTSMSNLFGENQGILGQLNSIFDINSPSKVFAKIGSYCIRGFARGASDDSALAASSMGSIADRAIAAFGNPLEYVSKIMSGELTYDPSIRPIMDMSSVRSGAMSINGMFQNQNVAVAGFSGRLAADIGQLQRDNQDVVDEIALLREDMADMTERMTNLQVVMNNGALVGQLAPGMDGEIGWRATRKGRGI